MLSDATDWRAEYGGGSPVGVLVEGPCWHQLQPAAAVAALRAAGHDVRLLVDRQQPVDLTRQCWIEDVGVLLTRGSGPVVLALSTLAEQYGVTVVNSTAGVRQLTDKPGLLARLEAAGVPVPRTWLGAPAQVAACPDVSFPVIVKPVDADGGGLHRVVASRSQLLAVRWPEPTALVQELHAGDGSDLVLDVVGDRVWAVRRPSTVALRSGTERSADWIRPVPVEPAVEVIARRCGSVLGLRLYAVRCVVGPAGPVVVDVEDYPDYRGASGADDQIVALVDGLLADAAVG